MQPAPRSSEDKPLTGATIPSPVSIRIATPADLAALSLIGQAAFLDAFAGVLDGDDVVLHCGHAHAREAYAALIADGALIWLACDRRAPVGYAVLARSSLAADQPADGDVELRRIYVLSRYQRAGIGRALMEHAVQAARARGHLRLLLGVNAENARATAFYATLGFRRAGRRRFLVGGTTHHDVLLGLDLATAADPTGVAS